MINPFEKNENGWIKIAAVRLDISTDEYDSVDFEPFKRKDGTYDYPYYRVVEIAGEKFIEVTGPNDYSEPWIHFIVPISKIIFIEPFSSDEDTEESDYWQR